MPRRRAKKKIAYVPSALSVADKTKRRSIRFSDVQAGMFGGTGKSVPAIQPWAPPTNLCESTATGKSARIAMDNALNSSGYYTSIQAGILQVDGAEGITFIGYPALAMLQQNPLMRLIVDTMSDESTRKWVSLKGIDDKVSDDDIKRVEGYCEKWALRKLFKDASEMVGFQGGCLLYIDMGVVDDKELITPLVISENTIGKGKFKGFRMVEPMQVYPGLYEASDPLKASYFNPETWIVLGKEVHVSRFLYFANNVPSTILRPAYNFFGIPLVQLVLQYVANFEGARDSSAEIVNNFALLGLKTDLDQMLADGGRGLVNRAKAMLSAKRNQGMALIDKDDEDFFQIATPLAGLKDLVSQQLELLALIPGIPVTKLFGTAPTGMNATGESDMRNFYDKTRTWQETLYFDNFIKARQLLELTEFGAITDGIVETWEPLQEPNPTEQATIRKINAETDAIYLEQNVILQEEVRKRLSADEESGYNGLELSAELPEPDPVDGPEAEALSVEGA